MGVLTESWCFCKGVGKSEKMKAAIFSGKGGALVGISSGGPLGTGFLIHRNLLLTSHVNVPSVAAAESAVIRLQDGADATLVPHRFFITSSVLDLTIVGLDTVDGDTNTPGQQPHYLKTCAKLNLDLGSVVYFLGYAEKEELTVGEGKVVIATDNLIKLSNDGIIWSPGSAGFDAQGNLAFMICDPMKLATSPNIKSSSTSLLSSSSRKKDSPLQFGIPVPVICDWLNQQWEGSLDELTKPKLPIIRLMSAGQKSEHSCASFTLRQVFKSTDGDGDGTPSSSNTGSKCRDTIIEERPAADPHATHAQGIRTPDIYESPKLTAVPLGRTENAHIQLLDINFPPRVSKASAQPSPSKQVPPSSHKLRMKEVPLHQTSNCAITTPEMDVEVASTASINGAQSEVQSSSPPVEGPEMCNGYGYSSEEETMYSAETAESRNYTSPREGKFQQVGRSQGCANHNRWGRSSQRNPIARRVMLDQQQSFIHGRKMQETSQRSNDYFSPTVSSIMKKRNSLEQQAAKPTQSAVRSSPRWAF